MKILHAITSIDKNSGGTSTYLQSLGNELCKTIDFGICAIDSNEKLDLDKRISTIFSRTTWPYLQSYSNEIAKQLNLAHCDIFHGNGLWEFPVHAMAKVAQRKGIPYIISPHGMLEPWSLGKGKWQKKLALALYQKKDLTNAACIHATARLEAENIRELGFKNPIAVIPNGIVLNYFPLKEINGRTATKKTILFLSRIHPKKGIELLIEAWSGIGSSVKSNWCIEIAGNGEQPYIGKLQQLIDDKGLTNEIKITGPQFGKNKLTTYHRSDLFVLPTYSENFGIVVAEALACGVPVITTTGAPWSELSGSNSGWWIDIGSEPLRIALEEALQLPEEKLREMGHNGRKLVEEKYSIEAVAEQMIRLYKWILKEGDKPEFVYE